MSAYYQLEGLVTRTTDKAVLFSIKDRDLDENQIWIPRSQIENGEDICSGDEELSVKSWFAEKEGLDG